MSPSVHRLRTSIVAARSETQQLMAKDLQPLLQMALENSKEQAGEATLEAVARDLKEAMVQSLCELRLKGSKPSRDAWMEAVKSATAASPEQSAALNPHHEHSSECNHSSEIKQEQEGSPEVNDTALAVKEETDEKPDVGEKPGSDESFEEIRKPDQTEHAQEGLASPLKPSKLA